MKRKLCALALCLCVCVSLLGGAAAAGDAHTVTGWELAYEGEGIDYDTCYAAIDTREYRGGEQALFVAFDADAQEGKSITLTQQIHTGLSVGAVYNISFYAKGVFDDDFLSVGLGTSTAAPFVGMLPPFAIVVTDAGNGWKKYSYAVIATNEPFFRIHVTGGCESLWIDEVSASISGGSNLVQNGGFERVVFAATLVPECVIVNPANGFLAVSWRNPAGVTLSALELYDVTDGKNTLLTASLDKGAGKLVQTTVAELTNGKRYYLKIVMTKSGGDAYSTVVSGVPAASYGVTASNWGLSFSRGTLGYAPGDGGLDLRQAQEGNASFHIRSNQAGAISNVYTMLSQTLSGTQVGKKYRLSFYAKGEAVNGAKVLFAWKSFDGGGAISGVTSDWRQFSYTLDYASAGSGTGLLLLVEGLCKDLWIDNISFRELVDGQEVGENLVQNPGFEKGVYLTPPATPANISATGQDGSVLLAWRNPSGETFSHVELYRSTPNGYVHVRDVYAPDSSLEVGGLANGQTHGFLLRSADALGNRSEWVEAQGETRAADYSARAFSLYRGTTAQTALAAGANTVKIAVKNSFMGDEFPMTLILALYRGDELAALASRTELVPQTAQDAPYGELSETITVPAGEGYRLEVFLWDNVDDMNSLKAFESFE